MISRTQRAARQLVYQGTSDPPFTPAAISGLEAWLDPSDGSSRSVSGGNFVSITDKSGNGNDATAAGPATALSTLNGVECCQLAGGHFTMPNFADNPRIESGAEVFIVLKPTNLTTNSGLWLMMEGGSSYFTFSDGKLYEAFGSTAGQISAQIPPVDVSAQANVLNCGSFDSDWFYILNESLLHQSNVNTVGWYPTITWLGQNLSGLAFSGLMGEFVLFNRKLTTDERALMTGYLKTKWGVP